MLLSRWEEVSALREAFDELLTRMNSIVEVGLQRAVTYINEKGLEAYSDPKAPLLSFWKRDWVNRKDDGIYGKIVGFTPEEFAREVFPHPTVFLVTEDFAALRMAESVEDFGKAVRASLTDDQRALWNHDVDLDVHPVGREYADVAEADRVRLVSDPEALANFLISRVDEFMALVPTIDAALGRMTRR
jgi:hypothetical protein